LRDDVGMLDAVSSSGNYASKKNKRSSDKFVGGGKQLDGLGMKELQDMLENFDLEDDVIEDDAIYSDGIVDVGELVSQLFSLKLDPYPKIPGSKVVDITFGTTDTGVRVLASSIGSSRFNFGKKDAQPESAAPSSAVSFRGTSVAIESASPQADTPDIPIKEQSATAKAASKIFDEVDTEKTAHLPPYRFESLLNDLGEGLREEELQRHLDLVDPDKTV